MTVWEWPLIGVFLVIYTVGAVTTLKWVLAHVLDGYWRLTLRRHGGIPVPVLQEWAEEHDRTWGS